MRTWIEKQKYLIDFTIASLARRKAKTTALLAIYSLIVFLLASVMLFTHALRREAAAVLANSPDVIVQRMVAGRHDLIPADYLDGIGRIRGVQRQEPRLWGYYYDPVRKANYTVMAASPEAAASVTPRRIVVGPAFARRLRLHVGDPMAFESYSGDPAWFWISAILPHESELASADLVLMTEQDFREFFNYPAGRYTDFALSVANPLEVRNVAAKIAKGRPDSRVILRDDILRTYQSIFDWREGIMLVLLCAAIVAFAILALDKASGLSGDERREIGILKAIGWEAGDIIRMKFWEGTLVSLTAFLVGYIAAYAHVFHFSARLLEPALKGWSTLYPRFDLIPVVDGLQVVTLFFFTVFPYAVATVVPIWRAAVIDPDAVMRG